MASMHQTKKAETTAASGTEAPLNGPGSAHPFAAESERLLRLIQGLGDCQLETSAPSPSPTPDTPLTTPFEEGESLQQDVVKDQSVDALTGTHAADANIADPGGSYEAPPDKPRSRFVVLFRVEKPSLFMAIEENGDMIYYGNTFPQGTVFTDYLWEEEPTGEQCWLPQRPARPSNRPRRKRRLSTMSCAF
jgi:hypothetical protein